MLSLKLTVLTEEKGFNSKTTRELSWIMVDESWFYLTSDAITVMLIEDMGVLVHPKVHHKSHIEKIMFLAVLGQPQKVIWKGEEIDFDGKIGLFPCTEEVATKRRSKAGPKGTRIQVNKNVNAEFYHNLFCLEGGGLRYDI